jgi:hypothetical protein
LRRDLGRPGRARWLAGRRDGAECWDAYEAIDGEPIHAAGAHPQPWSRVRHWLADLAHELTAGLDDGSLPALHNRRVWIDSSDRARILDWSDPGSGHPSFDPDAVAADLQSAQRVLYGVTTAALLGITPEAAQTVKPATPLPLAARKLLLSLRDGALQSTAALAEGVAAVANTPAVFPRARRGIQIGVSALVPVLTAVVTVGSMLFASAQKDLSKLVTPTSVWVAALAAVAVSLVVVVPFALLGGFLARGGFTLRAFGAAVVNRHGEPASRFRTLWRAIVTWGPAGVLSLLFLVLKNWKVPSPDIRALILASLGMALLVAGAVWTAFHPSRSIQDRIAGTWIVSR